MSFQSYQYRGVVALSAAGAIAAHAAAGVTLDSATSTLALSTAMSPEFDVQASASDVLGPSGVSGAFVSEVNNDLTFEPSNPAFPREFVDLSLVQSGTVGNSGAVITSGLVLNGANNPYVDFLSWAQDVQTSFTARWTVTEPTPFSIAIDAEYEPAGSVGFLFEFGRFGGPSIAMAELFGGPSSVEASGVLMPGEYLLQMNIDWESFGDRGSPLLGDLPIWSVNLQIPSPGAVSVFGLAGLAAIRRRR